MKRSLRLAIRIPIGFLAVIIMAVINSFMIASVFGGVGSMYIKAPVPRWSKDYDKNDPEFTAYNQRVASNWIGAINFMATDAFIGMSMAMVMQIPQMQAVYARERANKMYSVATNFLVVWASGIIIFSPYPIISGVLSYRYLEIAD